MIAVFSIAKGQEVSASLKGENRISRENAAFTWTATTFDFGKVKAGTPVTHEFTFVNSGDVPLVITSVRASCGCTVTSYSKDPVLTASTGSVKATYNAARPGQFTKTVSVQANTEEIVQLTIRGEVVE
jgi:hypothetical protein